MILTARVRKLNILRQCVAIDWDYCIASMASQSWNLASLWEESTEDFGLGQFPCTPSFDTWSMSILGVKFWCTDLCHSLWCVRWQFFGLGGGWDTARQFSLLFDDSHTSLQVWKVSHGFGPMLYDSLMYQILSQLSIWCIPNLTT